MTNMTYHSVQQTFNYRNAHSTSARSTKAAAVAIAVGMALMVTLPGTASAFWYPGTTGFITKDWLFFVQVGFTRFNEFSAVGNGSHIYAYSLTVNISSITGQNRTAYIKVIDTDTGFSIANVSLYVQAGKFLLWSVPLPVVHSYTPIRVLVDGTPGSFSYESPYTFLSFTSLPDGGLIILAFGVVSMMVIAGGILMWKSIKMTKRAIYAPKWSAVMWLHGIMIPLFAWYVVSFPSINSFFRGWEVFVVPIPECIFLFFWVAGRVSTNVEAMFVQVVPRLGHRLGHILRFYYIGQDKDGDLVIIKVRDRSVFRWWYRSRGHHVKLYRRREFKGPLEPVAFDAAEFKELSKEQLRNPARFPRGAKYDASDDFPVLNTTEDEDTSISRVYYVPRISDFKVTWPHLTMHREVKVPATVDPKTGVTIPEHTKNKLCWPYIADGSAEVTLASWHYADVIAQALGWITAEDMERENNDLSLQVAALLGNQHTETNRKAEARLLANREVINRPYDELSAEDQSAYLAYDKSRDKLPEEQEEAQPPPVKKFRPTGG